MSEVDDFTVKEIGYREWTALKSTLAPFLVHMKGIISEAILIDAVKELPALRSLGVHVTFLEISDASFIAMAESAHELRSLSIDRFDNVERQFTASDEVVSKMIDSCKTLEFLKIPIAGCESVLALKRHPGLREVVFTCMESVEESALSALLLGEEAKKAWSPTLTSGLIRCTYSTYSYDSQLSQWC
eukprot:scaffold539_cov187-Ochromonas_danica.AAC.31